MSHEHAAAVQEDGPAVEGKRLPFWKGVDGSFALLAIGAGIALVAAAYHIVQIVRGQAVLMSLATAGYVVAAIVAIFLVGFLRFQLSSAVIESACPRCGFRSIRSFSTNGGEHIPQECGSCTAYLRSDGALVREESPSFASITLPFAVTAERYKAAVRRDHEGHYEIPMPHVCAVCGSANARSQRNIATDRPTDFGVAGTVAKQYVRTQRQGALKPYGSYSSSGSGDELNLSLMQIPVCASHTLDADAFAQGVLYETDKLRFQNYGFYKQFLALNHIEDPTGQLTSGPSAS